MYTNNHSCHCFYICVSHLQIEVEAHVKFNSKVEKGHKHLNKKQSKKNDAEKLLTIHAHHFEGVEADQTCVLWISITDRLSTQKTCNANCNAKDMRLRPSDVFVCSCLQNLHRRLVSI